MDQPLKVDISLADESPEAVLSILREVGAQDVKQVRQRGLTGIETGIVGILVAGALANLVIRLSRLWNCGIIVDARGSRILTQKNCDLPHGTVLVISPNGTKSRLHEPSELQIKSLIQAKGK